VILVIGDGMGWEMARAGSIAKQIIEELEAFGCDIKMGCPENRNASEAFSGRILADYYMEGKSVDNSDTFDKALRKSHSSCFRCHRETGKGSGLPWQDLDGYALMTNAGVLTQGPNPGDYVRMYKEGPSIKSLFSYLS